MLLIGTAGIRVCLLALERDSCAGRVDTVHCVEQCFGIGFEHIAKISKGTAVAAIEFMSMLQAKTRRLLSQTTA